MSEIEKENKMAMTRTGDIVVNRAARPVQCLSQHNGMRCCRGAGHPLHHEDRSSGNRFGWDVSNDGTRTVLVAICDGDTPRVIADNFTQAIAASRASTTCGSICDVVGGGPREPPRCDLPLGHLSSHEGGKGLDRWTWFNLDNEFAIHGHVSAHMGPVPIQETKPQCACTGVNLVRGECGKCGRAAMPFASEEPASCDGDLALAANGDIERASDQTLRERVAKRFGLVTRDGGRTWGVDIADGPSWSEVTIGGLRSLGIAPLARPATCRECGSPATVNGRCIYCDNRENSPDKRGRGAREVAARARNEAALKTERPPSTRASRELAKPSPWSCDSGAGWED